MKTHHKKSNRTKLFSISLFAFCMMAVCMGACSKTDPLCRCCDANPAAPQVITFDWSADPAAAPAGMRVWLYPLDWQGDPIPIDMPGRDGGEVAILPGRYSAIAYNNDTEWAVASNTADFRTHKFSTPAAGLLDPMQEGFQIHRTRNGENTQAISATTDAVWAASMTEVEISASDTIRLSPRPLHRVYTFRFVGLTGLEHVAKASASISGMAPEVGLATLTPQGEPTTHPLAAVMDTADGEIKGEFLNYGPAPTAGTRQRMGLYIINDDGKRYKFTEGDDLDVTDQISSATDPRHVDIVVKGIKLPDTEGNPGTGMEVNVDDWGDDIITNLPI